MQEPSFTNFQAYFGSRRPFLWSVNWLFCRPCRPRNSDAFWGTVQVFEIPKDDRKIIKRQRLGQLGVASQLLKLWQIWWWSLPDLEELCFKHWKLKVYQLVCIYLDSKCWSAKTSNFPQGYTGKKNHLIIWFFWVWPLRNVPHLVSPSFSPFAPPHWSWVSPGPLDPWRCWSSSPLHSDP